MAGNFNYFPQTVFWMFENLQFSLPEAREAALFTSHGHSHWYLLQEKLKRSVLLSQADRFHKTQWNSELRVQCLGPGCCSSSVFPACVYNQQAPAIANPHLASSSPLPFIFPLKPKYLRCLTMGMDQNRFKGVCTREVKSYKSLHTALH